TRRHGGPAPQAARHAVRAGICGHGCGAAVPTVALARAQAGQGRGPQGTDGHVAVHHQLEEGQPAGHRGRTDGHRRRSRRRWGADRLPPGLRRVLGRPGHPDPPVEGAPAAGPPGAHRLGRGRLRGLLQDVHPPGLPGRAVPGTDPAAGLPLPPVDLQRALRCDSRVRAGTPPAAPVAHHLGRGGVSSGRRDLRPGGRPRILGAAMIDKTIDKSLRWVDDRLGVAKGGRTFLDKIFPDHWSFMLGEIALYSFVILLATGVFLSLYYVPSAHEIIYHGSYAPLRGQHVSEAYASSVGLSFDVRTGLLMRQAHHWDADIFLGAIAV